MASFGARYRLIKTSPGFVPFTQLETALRNTSAPSCVSAAVGIVLLVPRATNEISGVSALLVPLRRRFSPACVIVIAAIYVYLLRLLAGKKRSAREQRC